MNSVRLLALAFAAVTLSAPSVADDHPMHPCAAVRAACKAAGFAKGGHHDAKGLIQDCMKPIMEGKTVPGVTVSEADVTACKAKEAEHKAATQK